ncbi:KilA-N domain-containing protein [Aeromonas veronii]|uniref:KilA-N domain-containing protein n=1 Tax=Aeromonas veronii TaxID=654 RepID=UPI0031FE1B31
MRNQDILPVIGGVEIPMDVEGRLNLNALHRACGAKYSKRPNEWLRLESTKELIKEIQTVICGNLYELPNDSDLEVIYTKCGPQSYGGGTYAKIELAVSYAGWLCPKFQLKVNRTFIAYQRGELGNLTSKPQSILEFSDPVAAARAWADAMDKKKLLKAE